MKKHLLLVILVAALSCPPAFAAKDIYSEEEQATALSYSSIVDDLPLMPGMREIAESVVIFDKPEGRIASVRVENIIPRVNVTAYYTETLPPLGWYVENPQIYTRDGQMLTIRFDTPTSVLFELAPAERHKQRGIEKSVPYGKSKGSQ